MDQADTPRPDRNLAVDYYRVSGVILIVLGHWLAGSVTYHDGQFGRQNPLVDMPWTQWLTWPFQAVPVFFLVAGYAGAVSWTHHRESGGVSRQAWLRRRLARVLGPTVVYVALVSAIVVAAAAYGVGGSLLEYAGWAVAMHLWFLAVYVLVVSLTPIAIAAQRRWGLWVPVVVAVAVTVVDTTLKRGPLHDLGWLNYLFCWGTLYQLGIAWHGGLLAGRRPLLLATGSAIALALLIWLARYPVSMIGVPGQAVQNTSPPTVAMLAFGCAQAGIAMAAAPALNRILRAGAIRRVLAVGNNNVMALYLWHMIPVVIVALVCYPAGLLMQPAEGTAQWWLGRLQWVAILGLVTAVEMMLLWWGRRLFAAPLPLLGIPLPQRWAEPVMVLGAVLAAYGLEFVAADGFAPDEHFARVTVGVFAVGTLLVALRPKQVSPRPAAPATTTG
ncbi:acyltransferase [Mycobacterium ahvazicum]|uniref:Acyltransferase n=1 Tax=Mycobacterium ahvazicum TaxID=1964395 RepID=A0A2K4YCD5_9MYCO|nr:acyltransferase [Mycobacterium ahvazicum]SOX54434.1 acyltransferase [Mycobacterium ahvazicum]